MADSSPPDEVVVVVDDELLLLQAAARSPPTSIIATKARLLFSFTENPPLSVVIGGHALSAPHEWDVTTQ